jgi:uncharacterized repeat protein (TIGR01451 family)
MYTLNAAACGLALILAQILAVQPSFAQSPPAPCDLTMTLVAQKVIKTSDGKEELKPADRAFPGEVVQYDTTCQNQTDKPMSNVQPMLPIPKGMEYLPSTAQLPPAEATLDGGRFEAIPIKRKYRLPDGTEEEREVPATEYRGLRWRIPEIAPGAKVTVVARVRILPITP